MAADATIWLKIKDEATGRIAKVRAEVDGLGEAGKKAVHGFSGMVPMFNAIHHVVRPLMWVFAPMHLVTAFAGQMRELRDFVLNDVLGVQEKLKQEQHAQELREQAVAAEQIRRRWGAEAMGQYQRYVHAGYTSQEASLELDKEINKELEKQAQLGEVIVNWQRRKLDALHEFHAGTLKQRDEATRTAGNQAAEMWISMAPNLEDRQGRQQAEIDRILARRRAILSDENGTMAEMKGYQEELFQGAERELAARLNILRTQKEIADQNASLAQQMIHATPFQRMRFQSMVGEVGSMNTDQLQALAQSRQFRQSPFQGELWRRANPDARVELERRMLGSAYREGGRPVTEADTQAALTAHRDALAQIVRLITRWGINEDARIRTQASQAVERAPVDIKVAVQNALNQQFSIAPDEPALQRITQGILDGFHGMEVDLKNKIIAEIWARLAREGRTETPQRRADHEQAASASSAAGSYSGAGYAVAPTGGM